MKKLALILAICFGVLHLSAQKEIWLEAALKGGYGASFLVNKNILNDDDHGYQVTPGYNFGGKVAVNFGPFNGIAIEGLYSTMGQNLEFDDPVFGTIENKISWKSIDAILLYRHISNRVYVELGPMYSLVQSVEQKEYDANLEGAKDNYEKNYLSGVLGFGGYVAGTETFSLGLGIRMQYGLTDFVNSEGTKAGYPTPYTTYESNAVSRPAMAEFMVEFNFGIGRWARTSCSQRMKFFRSGR